MSDFEDDAEVMNSIKDSLVRQIKEVNKQIEECKTKQTTRKLELKGEKDHLKSKSILEYLQLKKKLHDYKTIYSESKKAWDLEKHSAYTNIMTTFLKQRRHLHVKELDKAQQALASCIRIEFHDIPLKEDLNSPEDTINETDQINVRSTCELSENDDRYLSANLLAVIEGNANNEERAIEATIQNVRVQIIQFMDEMNKKDTEEFTFSMIRESKELTELLNTPHDSFAVLQPMEETENSVIHVGESDEWSIEEYQASILDLNSPHVSSIKEEEHGQEAASSQKRTKRSWLQGVCPCFFN